MGRRKTKKEPHATTTGSGRPADQENWRTKMAAWRIKFDDEAKAIYLERLAEHGLKGRAAQEAGVTQATVAKHRKNDPDFEEAVQAADTAYRDKFVDHATTLAYEGIEVRKYDKEGNLIEERKDYPIRLIELELKRVEPGYREKQTIDLNGEIGGVMIAPAMQTPEDWAKEQEEKNKHRTKPGTEEGTGASPSPPEVDRG